MYIYIYIYTCYVHIYKCIYIYYTHIGIVAAYIIRPHKANKDQSFYNGSTMGGNSFFTINLDGGTIFPPHKTYKISLIRPITRTGQYQTMTKPCPAT